MLKGTARILRSEYFVIATFTNFLEYYDWMDGVRLNLRLQLQLRDRESGHQLENLRITYCTAVTHHNDSAVTLLTQTFTFGF